MKREKENWKREKEHLKKLNESLKQENGEMKNKIEENFNKVSNFDIYFSFEMLFSQRISQIIDTFTFFKFLKIVIKIHKNKTKTFLWNYIITIN